jgi:hypothetical protein
MNDYIARSLVDSHQGDLRRQADQARLARIARGETAGRPRFSRPRHMPSRRLSAAIAAIVLGLTVAAGGVMAQPASTTGDQGCVSSPTHLTWC